MQAVTTAFAPNFQVSSSNSAVATTQLVDSSSASAGSHTLIVTQLAQAESLTSKNYVVSNSSTPLNMSETLTLSVGAVNFPVPIATTDSIQAIADNINQGASENNLGITASVISTSPGNFQLMIASTSTGTANQVVVSESGSGSNALALQEIIPAKDAEFSYDGIGFTGQSSNSNIMIQGLNISLLSLAPTPGITINVSPTSQVATTTTALQNLITTYNQIDSVIEQAQAAGQNTDTTLSLVLSVLQNVMKSYTSGSGNMYNSLGSIGISQDDPKNHIIEMNIGGEKTLVSLYGQLTLDTGALSIALSSNFNSIQSLLTDASSGIFTKLSNSLTIDLTSPTSGSIRKLLDNSEQSAESGLEGIMTEISEGKDQLEETKQSLLAKYANLEGMLEKLKMQSLMLTQQIAMMSSSH